MSQATLLSESGLYKFIMRSDKPIARPFQDWVTREVLPAIRKDGAYISGEEKVATGEMSEDELVLKAVNILKTKVERTVRQGEKGRHLAPTPGLASRTAPGWTGRTGGWSARRC
jgi:prophage antirepressor-like protein